MADLMTQSDLTSIAGNGDPIITSPVVTAAPISDSSSADYTPTPIVTAATTTATTPATTITAATTTATTTTPATTTVPPVFVPPTGGNPSPSVQTAPTAYLQAGFGNITLPTTTTTPSGTTVYSTDYGAPGTAVITVTNLGTSAVTGPLTVNLLIGANATLGTVVPNGYNPGTTGALNSLLGTQTQNINLAPGASESFTFNYQNNTSLITPGAYHLIAQVDPNNAFNERIPSATVASQLVSAPGTNQVNQWIATTINAFQGVGEQTGNGIPPTRFTRLLAEESTAVYDAIEGFTHNYQSYGQSFTAPAGASQDAAVIGAAYTVLSQQTFFTPQVQVSIQQQLAASLTSLSTTQTGAAIAAGLSFGQTVANYILALRANDGSGNNAPYVPTPANPSDPAFVFNPPPGKSAATPNWGGVTPWVIPSSTYFEPQPPNSPTNNPQAFIADELAVKALGGDASPTDTGTTNLRTPDQTAIAEFWAYDDSNTSRPPGTLETIAQTQIINLGYSEEKSALFYATLNTALADAIITAWQTKYTDKTPRPEQVIAGYAANGSSPAVPATSLLEAQAAQAAGNTALANQYYSLYDPNWKPLLPTPNFPDYISGHSTLSGAWESVLNSFFGANYSFSGVAESLPGEVRKWSSPYQAAYEDQVSRPYGGAHTYNASTEFGGPTGVPVGQYVVDNAFLPLNGTTTNTIAS